MYKHRIYPINIQYNGFKPRKDIVPTTDYYYEKNRNGKIRHLISLIVHAM